MRSVVVEDPTEQFETSDSGPATLEGDLDDPTLPSAPLAASTVLTRTDLESDALSVMEREFMDAVDGVRSLDEIAEHLAINPSGARRLAAALLTRGVVART